MEAQATIALLWAELGSGKRVQAAGAMNAVREQYRSGAFQRRALRRSPVARAAPPLDGEPSADTLDRAWAAGFLDAEGWFGVSRSMPRKKAPAWYRIRVSASQHGSADEPPEVLIRLRRALGGLGRIERHGDRDDHKWLAEGTPAIERVLDLAGPWLTGSKLDQAHAALRAFRAQLRLRGDAERCARGHLYTGLKETGHRRQQVCSACDRLRSRMHRAAAGIPPRPFRNLARRYTF
ncbi:MAG: hypothetical protein ACRDGE_11785 [Candidatus Limnocylindria bacterium]